MTKKPNLSSDGHGPLPKPPEVAGQKLLDDEWITKVAETRENDVRAHRIALTYHHLALYLDELIHHEHSVNRTTNKPIGEGTPVRNANWFNFATWATLTVSQNIGNQQPLQRLNSGPGMLVRRLLTPAILNIKASGGQEVGRALAWGQLVIFNAACRALMRFVNHLRDASVSRDLHVDDLLVPLQRGMELDEEDVDEFNRFLAPLSDAVRFFAEARASDDLVTKAQLVLGANLRLTQVEQDFADKAVSIVVDLVPRRLAGAVDWRLAKLAERFRGMPPHLSFLVLGNLHGEQRNALDAMWSRFMTDQVLVMALPCETLRVGRDIPPLRRDRPYYPNDLMFPYNLDELRSRPMGDRLVKVAQLVHSLDRTVGNGRGSAARDWRRWDERLNWALTLLRTRQHDETLFWRPYSEHDECRIIAGDLPLRTGDPSALDVQPPLDPTIERRADTSLQSGDGAGGPPGGAFTGGSDDVP
jgi:hypothetical protein